MENKDSSKKAEEDFETKIQKIIDTFTKAEKLGKENSKKYKDWIKEISNPNFHLISNLLNYFLDELTSTNMRENIFKIMRKLYHLNKDVVGPQINSNKDFAKAIIVHINSGDKSKISDNCFYLLTKLFNHKAFKSQIDELFILALFEGLSIVREEDILNEIVFLLIEINYEYKTPEENIFIKAHKENENSRVLNEILLLRVLNNEHEDAKKIKILKCLDDLMSSYEKSIFYGSDFESFIDILLPQLEMTDNNELKKKLLDCLDRVIKYDEYYGQMYKIEEITELMEDFESAQEQPEEVRNICKRIIINITDRLGKNKKKTDE
jgi:hypothetical protein